MSSPTTSSGAGATATPVKSTPTSTAASPAPTKDTPATTASTKFEDPSKYKWTRATGAEVSRAEWAARRRCGLCQWCLSGDHATTNCPVQLEEKKESQAVALGNAAIGAEKQRRREARLCIYCGAKGHMLKACLKRTRAQLEAAEKNEVNVAAQAKEARRQAFFAKEAKEAAEKAVKPVKK